MEFLSIDDWLFGLVVRDFSSVLRSYGAFDSSKGLERPIMMGRCLWLLALVF